MDTMTAIGNRIRELGYDPSRFSLWPRLPDGSPATHKRKQAPRKVLTDPIVKAFLDNQPDGPKTFVEADKTKEPAR